MENTKKRKQSAKSPGRLGSDNAGLKRKPKGSSESASMSIKAFFKASTDGRQSSSRENSEQD